MLVVLAVLRTVLPALFSSHVPTTTEFLVPEVVYLSLDFSIEEDDRVPVVLLRSFAGGGCDIASNLQLQETYESDNLFIDIIGYNFTDGGEKGSCPAVIVESHGSVQVSLDWLQRPASKDVIFSLSGEENRYRISYDKCRVDLLPVEVLNVKNYDLAPGNNPQDAAAVMTVYLSEECPSEPVG